MMAPRWLREADGLDDVADARLAVGLRGEKAQQAKTNGVRQGLQGLRELLGVALAQHGVQYGRTVQRHVRHRGILTYLGVRRNIDARRYPTKGEPAMSNTFHVAVYVKDIPQAVEQYRKILG